MTDWPVVRLGDHIRVKHGFAFQGVNFSDSGEFIVVTPGNFSEGGGFKFSKGKEKWYSAVPPSDFILKQGDLILALTDLKQDAPILGSPARVPSNDLFLHNQRIGKVEITNTDQVDKDFLYYFFASDGFRSQVRSSATGSTVRHTAPVRICEIKCGLPSLLEQQLIANLLSSYDELIENNSRRIEILEEMAQAIYREWFVEFRYPGHEDVPLVDSELGLIPEGWEMAAFSDVAEFINGFAFKPAHLGSEGIPVIKIKELKSGIGGDSPRTVFPDVPDKYLIEDGDILFSWSAHLDAYVWTGGKAWLNQHLFVVRSTTGVPKYFLFHSLHGRMGEFRARSQGTTMKHIKRSALSEVKMAVPPASIMARFEEVVVDLHELKLNLTRAARNLRETRDLLLPRLISGEIDVSGLDIELAGSSV